MNIKIELTKVKVGGAHAANLTNPEPVNAAILDFLAGLSA